MDHPIRAAEQLPLRKKLASLIRSKYDLVRQDTIVFVCGGNDQNDARMRFLEVAKVQLVEYDFFTPESALKNPWQADDGPFELTRFEELIAGISLAVVIFPESPGSFCETGYFSAKDKLTKKMLLAINSKFQAEESFISTGPVHRVNERSDFRPTEYIDYGGDFTSVINRLKKRKPERSRKAIEVSRYRELSFVEKVGVIQKIVELLVVATINDVLFMFRSIFDSHISDGEIRSLAAVLRGSEYLNFAEPYGHFYINPQKGSFLQIRSGSKKAETEIRFEIAEIIDKHDDIGNIIQAAHNAC